jgi:hypothetical protein
MSDETSTYLWLYHFVRWVVDNQKTPLYMYYMILLTKDGSLLQSPKNPFSKKVPRHRKAMHAAERHFIASIPHFWTSAQIPTSRRLGKRRYKYTFTVVSLCNKTAGWCQGFIDHPFFIVQPTDYSKLDKWYCTLGGYLRTLRLSAERAELWAEGFKFPNSWPSMIRSCPMIVKALTQRRRYDVTPYTRPHNKPQIQIESGACRVPDKLST